MPLFPQCDDFKGQNLLDFGACMAPVPMFIQNWCCQCVSVGQQQHKLGGECTFLNCCLAAWCCAICARVVNRGKV